MANVLRSSSERRSEHLLNDLLVSQGWDLRCPPQGHLVLQHEYRAFPELAEALAHASKSGKSFGVPEGILIDPDSSTPLAVIETKGAVADEQKAIGEAQTYAGALFDAGWHPLAIGLAGTSDEEFRLHVSKRTKAGKWKPVTYEGYPIGWIPTRADLERVSTPRGPTDIRPTVPPLEVLAARANEINRLLREARIKDEYRPAVVAAVMLSLWYSKGEIRRDPKHILRDINESCRDAFVRAGKPSLAKSLRVDEANDKLKQKARRIATILERLNVTVLTAEHDYLGQLYETFFRYTGGNTIGQYFTPRHITRFMSDVCEVTKKDIVLDPACGTGGFLVACMDRILRVDHEPRSRMVQIVQKKLIGFEDEPVTAALCVANMILRGDGSTGVLKADCFVSPDFPLNKASVVLMNPPFPHEKTDMPVESLVDRALEGLKDRGRLSVIMPTGLLVKPGTKSWRDSILRKHSLIAVCELPDELFQPFASATTSFVVLEKGIPHSPKRKTVFVRLHHDGLSLHKGVRIERGPDQIPEALDAILNRTATPGFSGTAIISAGMEWAAGAYVESAPPEESELCEATDVLLRRLASFYTRYAPEVVAQRRAVTAGELDLVSYGVSVSKKKQQNAEAITAAAGKDEVGGQFAIYYGLGEIESREGIPPGRTLIISPTEEYNGCYGWLEFGTVLQPPFITVARTGSIGETFVHIEPCAPNSDCLVLLPCTTKSIPELLVVASAIRLEKWRYNYGRKITPIRLSSIKLPKSRSLRKYATALYRRFQGVIAASLEPYQTEDEHDIEIARLRLDEVDDGNVVRGEKLERVLTELMRG